MATEEDSQSVVVAPQKPPVLVDLPLEPKEEHEWLSHEELAFWSSLHL